MKTLRKISSDGGQLAACILLFAAFSIPQAVLSQTVYRSVDENGVVSFSDVASTGADVLELVAPPVREDAREEQQALIEQQLAVAKSLEESRLAREDARTKRLEALAAAAPSIVYYREADQYRYVGGGWNDWGGGYRPGFPTRPPPHKPGYPGRPDGPMRPIDPPPDVRPPSRPVPFHVPNGSGG